MTFVLSYLKLRRAGGWITPLVGEPVADWHCMSPGGSTGDSGWSGHGIGLPDGDGRTLFGASAEYPNMGAPVFLQVWNKTTSALVTQSDPVSSRTDGKYIFELDEPVVLKSGTAYILHVRGATGAVGTVQVPGYTAAQTLDGLTVEATRYKNSSGDAVDKMPTTFGTRTPKICVYWA